MTTLRLVPSALAFALGSLSVTGAATDTPASASSSSPSTDDAVFAERRAVEALDRISDVFPFQEQKRARIITISTDDLFDSGSPVLASSAQMKLEDLAGALKQTGDHKITVNCYTDSLGDPGENQALSSKRADALKQYLISRGVDGRLLQAQGLGARHPVSDNVTASGRAANRRIEIVIEKARAHTAPLLSQLTER
jgi:outer membrane protein OmpA-like peptidoglycan-associated protein